MILAISAGVNLLFAGGPGSQHCSSLLGFGTDTGYNPREGLKHELRGLNLMFSEQDIIKLMGPNTAAFIDMSDELGTLETGKLADIVVVEGDPLELIFNLLNVRVVIKGGEIVADHR